MDEKICLDEDDIFPNDVSRTDKIEWKEFSVICAKKTLKRLF